MSLANDIMKEFGAKPDQYKIRFSNRKFMNFLLNDYFFLSPEEAYKVSKLIDRKAKMEHKDFCDQSAAILHDKVETFLEILNTKHSKDFPSDMSKHESVMELTNIYDKLCERGVTNVEFDPTIVRGFDYYTGAVFEIHDTGSKNNRSLFGGGRYDDLVGIFGVEKVPGVGFGMGDVTIRDFMETYGLLPEYKSTTDLYIAPFDSSFTDFCCKLALDLREQGVNVSVDFTDRKVASKVKTADKEQIPWVVVIGQSEVESGKFKLKNLKESKEREVSKGEILALIKS
jgi:histidyl-tRNA synthetase